MYLRICGSCKPIKKLFRKSQKGLSPQIRNLSHLEKVRYTLKKVSDFPVPNRDLTYQTLLDREQLNYSRPVRAWLVTSQLGTGKSLTFLQCMYLLS
jgi:hypothetical protein